MDSQDHVDAEGGSTRSKRRRSARTQLRQAPRVGKRGLIGAVRDGRVTRSRARVDGLASGMISTQGSIIIPNDEDGDAIDRLGADEALSNSSYVSSNCDDSLLSSKNDMPLDASIHEAEFYHGGMVDGLLALFSSPGDNADGWPIVHDQYSFNGGMPSMGRHGGVASESKRSDSSSYTPLPNSFTHPNRSLMMPLGHTINPALLTPPYTHAETNFDRPDLRMALMDINANHLHMQQQNSPTPARITMSRQMSYQGMMQSPPSYYSPTNHFSGGNANPLCPRPSSSAAAYGIYDPFGQTNPMYMHGHSQNGHGFSGMLGMDPHARFPPTDEADNGTYHMG